MKACDIVRTKDGCIGLVTETTRAGSSACIEWIYTPKGCYPHVAWWDNEDVTVISTLSYVLSLAMADCSGSGRSDAKRFHHPNPPKIMTHSEFEKAYRKYVPKGEYDPEEMEMEWEDYLEDPFDHILAPEEDEQ